MLGNNVHAQTTLWVVSVRSRPATPERKARLGRRLFSDASAGAAILAGFRRGRGAEPFHRWTQYQSHSGRETKEMGGLQTKGEEALPS